MTIAYMREAIKKAYTSRAWEHRVNKMSDNQVLAIYTSFKRRGKL